jgi:hypothetical protein
LTLEEEIDMKSTTGYCAMALAMAGLLFAPVAYAQVQSAPPSSPANPSVTPKTVPDHKLDAAASAARKVAALQDTYEQKLSQAPSAEKKRIVDEADNAMVKAVTDQGLSVDEFKTIMELAQNDPAVRGKLLERLK